MKKYTLKKSYPGSPKVGTILHQIGDKFNNYWDTDRVKDFKKEEVENNPEFWEKIEEKEYEIRSWCTCPYKANSTEIFSIKRLSDGEIFTIGDKLKDRGIYDLIDGFIENYGGNKLWISVNKDKNYGIALNYAQKDDREVLFLTEDGVEIFEGDEYFVPQKDSKGQFSGGYLKFTADIKYLHKVISFSTKAAAEEFILMNKPCLSLKDVFEIYPQHKKKEPNTLTNHAQQLIQKVKRLKFN